MQIVQESGDQPVAIQPMDPPCRIIKDFSTVDLRFNVMPGKFVNETFFIKEYRIWNRYIEAEFDRRYVSDMRNSPSHVIFLTALTHVQKMLYLYMCHELHLNYLPEGDEALKIWPSKVNVKMPQMITSEVGIVHSLWITDLIVYESKSYKLGVHSKINNVVRIDGEAVVYRL